MTVTTMMMKMMMIIIIIIIIIIKVTILWNQQVRTDRTIPNNKGKGHHIVESTGTNGQNYS